jgi:cytochrome P450
VLRGAVDHAISQRRRSQTDSADLLSLLLSARDEETGEAMTDEQLRVEVTTFLLAGQETTSLALTWTWYLLSQHPDAQRRLEEEIDVVLDGRSPEYDDLANLPYTRMVIDEAMRCTRLRGASRGRRWQTMSWAASVFRGDGWRSSSPYVLHRLPGVWEDPEAFDPIASCLRQPRPGRKFVYLPFGAGPRQCIGSHFALIEAQLVVATLAQRYRLRLVAGHRVEPWPLITLRPRFGMPMTIERRTPSPPRAVAAVMT